MPRHILSGAASAAAHAGALLLLVVAMQLTRQTAVATSTNTFDPTRLVWVPNVVEGSGRKSGGDQSRTPPRRLQAPGRDEISIAATPDRSSAGTRDSAIEPLPISARPTGDAISAFVGAVTGESTGDSLGPNGGGAGDGHGPGNGFVDGARAGGPGVTTPIAVTQVKPQYTADAMRATVQGSVWLECVVLTDGTVGDLRVIRSLDARFGLDHEAMAAAKKWRFKPGLLNGSPVPVVVTIELSFRLR